MEWRRLYCWWVLLGLLAACAVVPFTQRRQVMLVSEAQEIALGIELYREILRQSILNRDPEANRIVRRVGERIAQAANKPNYFWEFVVIDDPEMVNAWTLPGGKVGVYTGIFPVADDEAGLAIIIGHEVAHALARHPGERLSQSLLVQLGALGLSLSLGGVDPYTADLIRRAYGLGTALGVMLPFSRAQELEADRIGLILAAKAGYDPRAARAVWERMAAEEQKRPTPPAFLSTHPAYAERRHQIEQSLAEALTYYRADLALPPVKLPALAALEPVEDIEKDLLKQMARLDRLAAIPGGAELLAAAIAEEFRITLYDVQELARSFSLRPGEVAIVLALADESHKSPRELVAEVAQRHSWPEVARENGVPLATVMRRLRAVERTARKSVHAGRQPGEVPATERG
ncbi:MAG: M48 family metallopeptidase [Candidatus Binatia bacterium]|nr:M48 family metallopeptidase [Candidatus Binatia bacterium]